MLKCISCTTTETTGDIAWAFQVNDVTALFRVVVTEADGTVYKYTSLGQIHTRNVDGIATVVFTVDVDAVTGIVLDRYSSTAFDVSKIVNLKHLELTNTDIHVDGWEQILLETVIQNKTNSAVNYEFTSSNVNVELSSLGGVVTVNDASIAHRLANYSLANCSLSTAYMDNIINDIYDNRYVFNNPVNIVFDISGNDAPTGVYQTAVNPSTPLEKIYALENDPYAQGFVKWSVTQ